MPDASGPLLDQTMQTVLSVGIDALAYGMVLFVISIGLSVTMGLMRVVNLAHGGHLVEADLLQALDSGQLDRAVLDVFRQEPLVTDHPFWCHPRVTVLPHSAAATDMRSAALIVAQNLQALRDGRQIRHLVQRKRGY